MSRTHHARAAALPAVAVLLAHVGCASQYPLIKNGPFAGYEYEVEESSATRVHETGVFVNIRGVRRSQVGRAAEYATVTMAIDNQSDFAFCVRITIENNQSDVTVWGDGAVTMVPAHSRREDVVGLGVEAPGSANIKYTWGHKLWPADREGHCGK